MRTLKQSQYLAHSMLKQWLLALSRTDAKAFAYAAELSTSQFASSNSKPSNTNQSTVQSDNCSSMLHICSNICVIHDFLFDLWLVQTADVTLLTQLISDLFSTYIVLLRGLTRQMQLITSKSSPTSNHTCTKHYCHAKSSFITIVGTAALQYGN